jgi:hypothetical protein
MISEAIQSLRPGAQWAMNGEDYDQLIWVDEVQTKPTKEEVLVEAERLRLEFVNKQYQQFRYYEYPSIKDFADAYYWSQKGDNTLMDAYVAKCDAVKAKYPKPE